MQAAHTGPRQNWPEGPQGIWAIHMGPIWAPPWTNLGNTRAVHTGHRWAPRGWPVWQLMGGPRGAHAELARGAQGAHSGDTRGTHLSLSMNPSEPHTGSPHGSQVGPMRGARRATYGRPTWGPRRIGQRGHKGPMRAIHVGSIWAPPWTHLGPTRAVHTSHMWARYYFRSRNLSLTRFV